MKLNDYAKWTEKTCADLNAHALNDVHMLFGLITEVGELVDPFKKKLAYNKEIDYINVQEEIGDIMYYLASFCRQHDFDLEKILDKNVAKLEARYPNKFDSDHAINRNLDKEREILER
jgi:NTP pyrophosphatase (non-canonical NTP hydrolase)